MNLNNNDKYKLTLISQIEAEQEIIKANKKLIQIYEQKIKDKRGLGRVRGENEILGGEIK